VTCWGRAGSRSLEAGTPRVRPTNSKSVSQSIDPASACETQTRPTASRLAESRARRNPQ
jgi:hypothetical protein